MIYHILDNLKLLIQNNKLVSYLKPSIKKVLNGKFKEADQTQKKQNFIFTLSITTLL